MFQSDIYQNYYISFFVWEKMIDHRKHWVIVAFLIWLLGLPKVNISMAISMNPRLINEHYNIGYR